MRAPFSKAPQISKVAASKHRHSRDEPRDPPDLELTDVVRIDNKTNNGSVRNDDSLGLPSRSGRENHVGQIVRSRKIRNLLPGEGFGFGKLVAIQKNHLNTETRYALGEAFDAKLASPPHPFA